MSLIDNYLEEISEEKRDSLEWACRKGNLPVIEFLIGKGANIHAGG